ncbi:MAG: tRNA dihydrouridine synthase DusB [Bacillota bacterium]|nr:tRNA dihydrouridine synthase DusB [Bacillota bacterium]
MRDPICSIGGFPLEFPFILAPLAGITDGPFRLLCREQGAGLTYTEMVSVKGLYYKSKNTEMLLAIGSEEGPVGIQIFGSEPGLIARAARQLRGRPNVLLDINMGCPVPKVVKNGEGAALLRDPALAAACVRAAAENAEKPVTVKMRVGFSDEPFDCCGFAAEMEAAGCAAVTVHGRTREQYYSGKADWDKIARIKKTLRVPVIGNGDVFSAEGAIRMMEHTGCDGVMIARGALGNPWIFREIRALWEGRPLPPKPSPEEIRCMMLRHLHLAVEAKGEYAAVREMRKHVGWYVKGLPGAAAFRRTANSAVTTEQLQEIVCRLGTSSGRLE